MAMASTSSTVHEVFLFRRGSGNWIVSARRNSLKIREIRGGLRFASSFRARSAADDRIAVLEDEELMRKLDSYDRNGNGNGNGRAKYLSEESRDSAFYVNGNGNGSLATYVNGNGVVKSDVVEEVKEKKKEIRTRTIEEIGQEEAWFKKDGKDKLEVIFCFFNLFLLDFTRKSTCFRHNLQF